jgi:protein involved in polysaccharide export with SLBB domain
MNSNRILKLACLWWLACLELAFGALGQVDSPANARKIQPNDVLLIRVLNEVEMTAEKKVSADGKIDYFFINEVDLNDKTVADAQRIIRDALDKDYLVNPQVYVEVKQYATQYVTVVGQVQRPGQYPIPPDHKMDIIEAIGTAGDFSRLANKNKIELRRKETVKRYSYDDLKKPDGRVYVEPEDVIEVAESKF